MSEFQSIIQPNIFQGSESYQDVKTVSARSEPAPDRVARRGGVGAGSDAPVTPDTFNFYVAESLQWQGKKTLVIDRDTVTVELPPAGNTGVTVTYNPEWYKDTDHRTLVDTVEVTFKVKTQEELIQVIDRCTRDFGGGQDLDRGLLGYPCQRLLADGARLLYDPNRLSQGVHLIVGGEAAQRHALRINDPDALLVTFINLQEYKLDCNRFDVACDRVGLPISVVNDAIKAGQLVTRTRKARRLSEFDPSTGEDISSTIYIGSVRSDRMVRFYDKSAESGIVDATITRCEVQHRRDYAQVAFVSWLRGDIDPESLVASAVDFREVTADSNVTRRPRLSWWSDWLGKFPRITLLSVDKPIDSVKRSLTWFRNQVAPTFAFLLRAMPDADWITHADTWGEFKMSSAKRALLAGLENIDRAVRESAFSGAVGAVT